MARRPRPRRADASRIERYVDYRRGMELPAAIHLRIAGNAACRSDARSLSWRLLLQLGFWHERLLSVGGRRRLRHTRCAMSQHIEHMEL